MEKKKSITQSEISDWLRCRKLHKFGYIDLLKPHDRDYGAMAFGTDMHKWVAELNSVLETSDDRRLRITYKVDELKAKMSDHFNNLRDDLLFDDKSAIQGLCKYQGIAIAHIELAASVRMYQHPFNRMILVESEREFCVPIKSTKSYPNRTYNFEGKIDGVFRGGTDEQLSPSSYIYELKTTGRYGESFNWTLQNGWQTDLYALATSSFLGREVSGTIFEVMNTRSNFTLKKEQSLRDYVDEVSSAIKKKELETPGSQRTIFINYATKTDKARKFLWDMATEIRLAEKGKMNQHMNPSPDHCRWCCYTYECASGDLSTKEVKPRRHMELGE